MSKMKAKKEDYLFRQSSFFGRSIGIRTRGLLDPNQARYQTSPYPDNEKHYSEKRNACQESVRTILALH